MTEQSLELENRRNLLKTGVTGIGTALTDKIG
jgi:hypothetical protein